MTYRYNNPKDGIPVGRQKPYGYYNGYHIRVRDSELAQVVEDAEGHFCVSFYGSIWRREGDIESYNPFIAKSILVPENIADNLLTIAFNGDGELKTFKVSKPLVED